MSGDVGKGHLVHYLSPHVGLIHAIASGFGSLDAKGDWSKVTCPACLAHHPAPDAAEIEAALAAGLAAHGADYIVGKNRCICGAVIHDDSQFRAHVAAALLPVVTQAQAEALREAADEVFHATDLSAGVPVYRSEIADWLRARADESGAS